MTQIKDTQNNFRISVNISPRHFMKPGFKDWIIALFSEHSLHPSRIMLEITEGLFLSNTEVAIRKMNELVDLGFVFSIDDFGTGYSSLAYLKKLPLRELKIDKSFVQDAPDEPNDAALVESIIAVAQNLGLEIVAEGVETEQQADFLASRGDMLYQGYFFGKPVPAADLLSNLATQP
ncbi:MAG TPA: EAL domain-containing protein, partial [Treponemataceae bacterium]|nr:EAL domain-containing protein [Treponemataceae bacterium]